MASTRNHSETLKQDLQTSAEFRLTLLAETAKCWVSGDLPTGKFVQRESINGTIGFVALSEALDQSPESLMRMLGPQEIQIARNLLDIPAHLQRFDCGPFQIKFVSGLESVAA